MLRRSLRLVIALALLLAAIASVLVWLGIHRATPAPTPFGWRAALTTVAGDGVRGDGDGAGVNARFSDPFAVAIDAGGMLYVADAGDADRIRRIDPEGRVTTLPGRFNTPSGVAIDDAGNVIVADTGDNAIRAISPAGVATTLAGDGTAGFRDGPASRARFNGPIGVATDHEGNVYIADTYNDRIRVITADGQVRTLAGGGAPGFADGRGGGAAFNTPCGLAVDSSGALLVADAGNDAIRKVGIDGQVSTLARTAADDHDGPLRMPVGLAATWDGFVYVASFRRGRIVEISPSGKLHVLAGRGATDPGNAALRLGSPAGLAIGRDGVLYVADPSVYAVRKLHPRYPHATAADLEPGLPALVRAPTFPWPVRPQYGWHEVVGDMGEVRGDYRGEPRDHIHAGLDIHAEVGAPVLAAADEKVESPLPASDLDGLSEGLRVDALTYIHIRVGRTASGAPLDPARFQPVHDAAGRLTAVRVKRGTRFHVGDQLGTVNRMAHVHLELGPPGGEVNPMMLRFAGLADHVAPRIGGIAVLDGSGRRLTEQRQGRLIIPADGDALSIVVDAWDQVDGDAPRRRLGLYKAGFQLLRADGSPMPRFERPRINLKFDRVPLDADAAKIIYAPSSGDAVHSDQPTRFLYVVTNHLQNGRATLGGWCPAGLMRGDYTIRIFAANHAGNEAEAGRDLPITIR